MLNVYKKGLFMKKYLIIGCCFFSYVSCAPVKSVRSFESSLYSPASANSRVVARELQARNKPKEVVDFNIEINKKTNSIQQKAELLGRLEKPKTYIAEIKSIQRSLSKPEDIKQHEQKINYLLKKAERASDPSLARRAHRFVQKKLGIKKKKEEQVDDFVEIVPVKKERTESQKNFFSDLSNVLQSKESSVLPSQIKKQTLESKNQKEEYKAINKKLIESFEELRQNESAIKPPITPRKKLVRPVPAPKPEWLKKKLEPVENS